MSTITSTTICYEGIDIDVKFKNIRTLRLVIHRDGTPSLSVPITMPQQKVLTFLQEHRDWLKTKQAETIRKHEKELADIIHSYAEGEIFKFFGKSYPLRFGKKEGPAQVICTEEAIWVYSRKIMTATQTHRLLQSWYSRQFHTIIQDLVNKWLIKMNEKPLSEIRFPAGLMNILPGYFKKRPNS